MLADLKPYPVMKNSGVPWLGSVPEHWDIRRGKWLFRYRKQINSDRTSTNVLSLTLRGVVNNDPDNPEGLVPKDYATYQLFRKGDLVFKLIDLENLRTSRVGLVHEDGIMSSAYVRLTSHAVVDIRFFFQQYFDLYQRGIYNQLGAGVRSTLGQDDLLNLSVVVPPLFEQAAIVHFLNYADRRIQRYIHAKQKLIKLLEEQKQAIIHRAVTCGLDPNVRLKPSGVEWLGDVPEHWEVMRLHQVTDPNRPIMYGIVLPGPNVDHGVYIVKGGNCEPGRLRPELLSRTTFEIEARYAKSRLKASDIVFEIRGGVGESELVPSEIAGANLTQDAARIAAAPNICSRWLLYAVRAPIFQAHVQSQVVGATVRGINIRDLKRMELVVPPPHEQTVIARYLDDAVVSLDTTTDRAHREISLLREYRTRLIADVVTGKLDVREAAARLPDESAASEPFYDSEVLAEGEESGDDADPGAAPEEAEA